MTRSAILAAVVLVASSVPAIGRAAEPVAYVTEIRRAAHVQMKSVAVAGWIRPQPLTPLAPGDQLRASGEAQVVILFHAGGAVQTITVANSPYTVPATPPPPPSERLRVVTGGLVEFLLGKQAPPSHRRLGTRDGDAGTPDMPVIIAPRETRLFRAPITLQWEGSERLRYTIRVSGPSGVLWETERFGAGDVHYPDTAPALEPGVVYTWSLIAAGSPPRRARFEIIPDAEAARIRQAIMDVSEGMYPRTTAVLLRMAALYHEGCYDAARREIEAEIATSPRDPTLYLLAARVYDRIGLGPRAVRALEAARTLAAD